MSKKFYINSPKGCVSHKGYLQDNLTTKDGDDIFLWESEEAAIKSFKIQRENIELKLDNMRGYKKTDPFAHFYERWIKGYERTLEFINSCEIKELSYN